jgi:hypothetical protein
MERREKVMANGISKATSLPAISVGFAISILVATWIAGARFEGMERADAQAIVQIQDVADRQKKYIGTTGLLTEQLEELQDQVTALERELALLKVRLELDKD